MLGNQGKKNTIPHLLVQYSSSAQPQNTLELIDPNLKSLTNTGNRFFREAREAI